MFIDMYVLAWHGIEMLLDDINVYKSESYTFAINKANQNIISIILCTHLHTYVDIQRKHRNAQRDTGIVL